MKPWDKPPAAAGDGSRPSKPHKRRQRPRDGSLSGADGRPDRRPDGGGAGSEPAPARYLPLNRLLAASQAMEQERLRGLASRYRWALRLAGVALATVVVTVLGAVASLSLYLSSLARDDAWASFDLPTFVQNLEWRHGWVAWLLLLLPVIWWFATFGQDKRQPRLRIGTVVPLRGARRGLRVRLRDLPGVLRTVALAFLALALARPVSVLSGESSDEKGIDIVVVMDLSGSMRAVLDADPRDLPRDIFKQRMPRDRRLTRLDTAKIVVQDFISRRRTDRIGVIVFGTNAYVLSPPTLDYQLLSTMVSQLSLNVIDSNATAIGDALGTGVARLRRSDALSKVIILLTDGASNAGAVSPEYAIELANTVGCKTYTIQIGTGDEVEVQDGYDLFGQPRYRRQRFPTNPELLQRISKQTGAEFFLATDAKALAQSMHDILDQLEKTRFEASVASYKDLFTFLLIPGVLLLALDALLRAWLLRRFP